ncbi:MAG: hypothetical protein JWO02_3265 [Solirubrobacterales bacterium]|nr:hypothetical protein [Solirubrobacterales bacterium]
MSELDCARGTGGRLDRTRLTVGAGPLVGPVLARVIAIHASRAQLPLDRVGDALLIADAIASHAPALAADGRVPVSVQSEAGRLEIRVGPLQPGSGRRLLDGAAIPHTGRVVERLADDVRVRSGVAGGETLVLRLAP